MGCAPSKSNEQAVANNNEPVNNQTQKKDDAPVVEEKQVEDVKVEEAAPAAEEAKPAEEAPVAEEAKPAEEAPAAEEAVPVAEDVSNEPVAAKNTEVDDLKTVYYDAHTAHGFLDKPVDDALLEKALELAQLAPTAFNCCPMRVVFVKSEEGKKKLEACLMEGNKAKTMQAPVTAIVAFDTKFYEKLPILCPAVPGLAERYASDEAGATSTLIRNANLQAGYLMLALRSLDGLSVGPMSGFDNDAVDAAFLQDTNWKSNFLINIGYADVEKNLPRAPRLGTDAYTFA